MSRHLKQTIYGTLYLVILALIVWGFYSSFFSSAPTCFDNKKNQNEEGIDCGGSCQKICLPENIREIKVVEAKIFPLENGNATLLGVVNDPNADYAIKNFTYNFNITKANATSSVSILSGNSFIYPEEKAYLIFPNAAYQPAPGDKLEITLSNLEWVKKENFEKPDITIKNYTIIETQEGIRIEGVIFNDTFSPISDVRVFVILHNQFQKAIGVSQTFINLESKKSTTFSIFHPLIEGFRKELTVIDFSTLPNN